jgi:predicted O-methyltransferase YrrM
MINHILNSAIGIMSEESDLIDRLVKFIMEIEGQISQEEARTLMTLARESAPDSAILEIGSFRGRSTIALAAGAMMSNRNRVYAVDPHDHFRGVLGGLFGPSDQAELYKNICASGLGEIIAVVSLPSTNAASGWPGDKIGLLWLDGDHRYSSVRADFDAWEPYVLKGGIIAFHDIQLEWVRQCVHELCSGGRILHRGAVDTLSWFVKHS